jgi:hypothetical protein
LVGNFVFSNGVEHGLALNRWVVNWGFSDDIDKADASWDGEAGTSGVVSIVTCGTVVDCMISSNIFTGFTSL